MIKNNESFKRNIFLNILLFGIIISILISFYYFYYKKDFDFIVETNCNTEYQSCFYRDCEGDPGVCPPNNFSYYRQFTIKAKDFKYCQNEDCQEACKTGVIRCVETLCTNNDIDSGLCVSKDNN